MDSTTKETANIWVNTWEAKGKKSSSITFIHGLDHSSRHVSVFDKLNESGIQVVSFDQRGFGHSQQHNSESVTWKHLFNDLQEFLQSHVDKTIPHYLYGFDFGAILAVEILIKNQESKFTRIDGIILNSPLFRPILARSTLRRSISKIKEVITPTGLVSITSVWKDLKFLTRNQDALTEFNNDKLVNQHISVSLVNEIVEEATKVTRLASNITCPILILQGDKDRIADVLTTQTFYEQISSKDKKYVEFKEAYHDLHHEPEKEEVIKTVADWLHAHSPLQENPQQEPTSKEKKVEESNATETKVETKQTGNSEMKETNDPTPTKQEQPSKEAPPTTTATPAKKTVADFEFLTVIGKGAFGQVKLAKEKETGREYAVKVLDKQHIKDSGKSKYVHTERNIFSMLQHPNVVKLFYTFQDPRNLYYVLELCPNGSLQTELTKLGSLNEDCVRFYIAEVVNVLECMHSKGIIHRDLKPDNVLLDAKMHAKMTDFGTSKIIGTEERARSDSFCGTEEYVSPELLDDNDPFTTKSSDLWALGVMIYQLISGKVPWKGENGYQTFQLIKKGDIVFTDQFSEDAKDLIQNLLVSDFEKRLGAGTNGYDKLKAHPFFSTIDFSNLHNQNPPTLSK